MDLFTQCSSNKRSFELYQFFVVLLLSILCLLSFPLHASANAGKTTGLPTSSGISTGLPTSSGISTGLPTSSGISTGLPTSSSLNGSLESKAQITVQSLVSEKQKSMIINTPYFSYGLLVLILLFIIALFIVLSANKKMTLTIVALRNEIKHIPRKDELSSFAKELNQNKSQTEKIRKHLLDQLKTENDQQVQPKSEYISKIDKLEKQITSLEFKVALLDKSLSTDSPLPSVEIISEVDKLRSNELSFEQSLKITPLSDIDALKKLKAEAVALDLSLIEAKENDKFDAKQYVAKAEESSTEISKNRVIRTDTLGYKKGDQVILKAKVILSRG